MKVQVINASNAAPTAISRQAGAGRYTIQNLGPNAIWVGDANVTTANGFKVAAGAERTLNGLAAGYIIAETAAQVAPANTRVLFEGVT